MAAAGAARAAALAANAVKKTKGGNVAERENSDTMTRQQLLSKLKDDEDLFYLFNIGEGTLRPTVQHCLSTSEMFSQNYCQPVFRIYIFSRKGGVHRSLLHRLSMK